MNEIRDKIIDKIFGNEIMGKVIDKILDNKIIVYCIFLLLLILSTLTTFFKNFLYNLNLDVTSIKYYSDFEELIFIVSLICVIFAIIFEAFEYFKRRKHDANIKRKLTQIRGAQIAILIECFKKQEQSFTLQSLSNLEKTINDFGKNFQTYITPLLDSELVKQCETGRSESFKIEQIIWNKLTRLMPNYEDMIAYDKFKSAVLDNSLKDWFDCNYRAIPRSFLKKIDDMERKLSCIKFSEKSANGERIKAVKCLKNISDILSRNCRVNDDMETFSIYIVLYDEKLLEHRKTITAVTDNCGRNVQNLIEHLSNVDKLHNYKEILRARN